MFFNWLKNEHVYFVIVSRAQTYFLPWSKWIPPLYGVYCMRCGETLSSTWLVGGVPPRRPGVQTSVSPCEICDGRSVSGRGFYTKSPLSVPLHHCSIIIHTVIYSSMNRPRIIMAYGWLLSNMLLRGACRQPKNHKTL